MADFVAVLRKTLDGIDGPSPEVRQRVYAKARTTITAKLEAISPKPPQNVIDKQLEALEAAISEIETGYGSTRRITDSEDDPLAEFVSGAAFGTPVAPKPADAASLPAYTPPPSPVAGSAKPEATAAAPFAAEPPRPVEPPKAANTAAKPAPKPLAGAGKKVPSGKRGYGGLIAAVIMLLLLAGAGYGIWQNKDDFARMVGLDEVVIGGKTSDEGNQATSAGDAPAANSGQEQAAASDGGADKGAAGTNTATAEEDDSKFTQRLMADGSEVDEGPAGAEPTVGEGTSVAAASSNEETPDNATGAEQPPVANAEGGNENVAAQGTDENANATGAEAPEGTAVPVGQRAIFYEERTTDLQGSAQTGAVVWSVVQESPGADLPPEPAIRAEANIPGKNIQFVMTIHRNADETLPASHIIEMVFITPDNFDGGAIENVLRIAFKDTEQSAGNPLLGIPAKIQDGFFLLALTDSKADIEANMTMMRRQEWLDVPIVYSSGRRALITMEKGVPGSKVFDEALKAWATASSG